MGSTLLSSINIGRETLMSHGSAMSAMADNVSNSNTTGFKAGVAEFSDLLAGGAGAVGNIAEVTGGDGAYISRIRPILSQGALEPTGKPYDLAIDGPGYFTLARPDAEGNATADLFYTRAGNFQLDSKGRLVNSDGFLVMATPAGGGDLAPISLAGRNAKPVASTVGQVSGNLDADTPLVTGLPETFTTDAQVAVFKPYLTSMKVIDALGSYHDVTLAFFKTDVSGEGVATWDVRAFANGEDVQGGTPGALVQIGKSEIKFGSDGIVQGDANINFTTGWANGAPQSNVTLDLSEFTGFAQNSFIGRINTNGTLPGTPKSIGFDSNGQITVVLDNGDSSPLGVLALAKFPNELGLQRAGSTLFTPSGATGEVQYGAPKGNGFGILTPGNLETSNVDLADQFVNVIRIQRTYQAGSQVIKTANELLNSTLQIV